MTPLTNQLIELYEPITRACCRSLPLTEHDIEDLLHDIFLAAYRNLPNYRHQSKMSSWLWTIARRQIINQQRKLIALQQRESRPMDNVLSPPPSPVIVAQTRELRDKLHQSIETLPAHWQRAIQLFYWHHKSTYEIAMTLQIEPGTIRVILHRSRQRLRQELERMNAA